MSASVAQVLQRPRVVSRRSPSAARREDRRHQRALLEAGAALVALAVLALILDDAKPVKRLDRAVRRLASSSAGKRADRVMAPLFPVGLPGVYIPFAHLVAWRLRRRGAGQAWRIPATAWAAWLAHRGVKLVYERERPRGRDRAGVRKPRRVDSYPSGHTTGITALSGAIASVLNELEAGNGGVRAIARSAAVAAPLLMGVQRLVADDHWASDVLGGLALGSAVAQSCRAAARVISKR